MLRDRFRRGRATSTAVASDGTSTSPAAAPARAAGRSFDESRDWARVGLFGAGILVGAMLGAGAALLYAPQSGIETRLDVRRKARRLRAEATGKWDDVTGGVRGAARRGTKRVRRSAARARWAASDAFEG